MLFLWLIENIFWCLKLHFLILLLIRIKYFKIFVEIKKAVFIEWNDLIVVWSKDNILFIFYSVLKNNLIFYRIKKFDLIQIKNSYFD